MTRFHFSKIFKSSKTKSGKENLKGESSGTQPSKSAEAGEIDQVISNMVFEPATPQKASSSSKCSSSTESSFDVASDITERSVERIFHEANGFQSVMHTAPYTDNVKQMSSETLEKELQQEINMIQQMLGSEGETANVEVPWEKNHKRVLTMTVETNKHKHKSDDDNHAHHHHHRHHHEDPVQVNNDMPSDMATNLPIKTVPLHKEFACMNLDCVDPQCVDMECASKADDITKGRSDPDFYSSRYALDTAVVHGDRALKHEEDILHHEEKEIEHADPILIVIDRRNKFHPIIRQIDAKKIADIYHDYHPTMEQKKVVETLKGCECACQAAHDISVGTFMRTCQEENLMCDVTFSVEGDYFTAHRTVLAQFCGYFREIFCLDERNVPPPFNFRLRGISADSFESFLKLLYTGACDITIDTAMDLLVIASKFSVDTLREKVKRFLENMSIDDILDLVQRGMAFSSEKIFNNAIRRLRLSDAIKSPKFLELSPEVVCLILSSDYLNVEHETEVFDAGMMWIMHQLHSREQHLAKVLECVRFPLMTTDEFFDIFQRSDLLLKNAYCREMLKNAHWMIFTRTMKVKDPHQLQHARLRQSYINKRLLEGESVPPGHIEEHFQGPNTANPTLARFDNDKQPEFVRTAQTSNKGEVKKKETRRVSINMKVSKSAETREPIRSAGEKEELWKLKQPETKPVRQAEIQSHTQTEIAEEGQEEINAEAAGTSKQADTVDKERKPEMPSSKQAEETLIVKEADSTNKPEATVQQYDKNLLPGDILAFGGFFSGSDSSRALEGARTIKCFKKSTQKWEHVTNLPRPRLYQASAVLNGKIYVVGGADPRKPFNDTPVPQASGFCFDPLTRRWSLISPMSTPRMMHSLCALGGLLYAIGGQDGDERVLSTVECYDPDTNSWQSAPSISVPRLGASASVMDGKIFIGGGFEANMSNKNGTPISSVFEYFDPKVKRWKRLGDLRIPRCHGNMVTANNDLYFCGGATRTRGLDFSTVRSVSDVDKYNKAEDIWEKVANLDTERHACGSTVVDDKIYICGGATTSFNAMLYTMEVYDTKEKKWDYSVEPCPFPGRWLCLVTVPDPKPQEKSTTGEK